MSVCIGHRRILSRGDIPGSDGGIYNPGAIRCGEHFLLLCRREIDYRFSRIVHAERVLLDGQTLAMVDHCTLRGRGYPDDARIEDLRCMAFAGQLLAVHSLVRPGQIRPMISRFDERDIEPWDHVDLPIDLAPVEKNWVLFEHDGALHCLYRLDPLTVFVREGEGSWRLLRREENGWAAVFENVLSNSTNLIPFMGGYLGFWHSIIDHRYVQGALLLDGSLQIRYTTGVLLDGGRVRHGHKPGVIYVSALVRDGGHILAFYGEGDAHCSVAILDAPRLEAELLRNPFAPTDAVKIRLAGTRMGDLFRTMIALQGLRQNGRQPTIYMYVDDLRLATPIGFFGIPKLAIRAVCSSGSASLNA